MNEPAKIASGAKVSGGLPPIHIMAGGLHALPYARFAAECLWHQCPEALRNELRVNIGVFAVSQSQMADAVAFLKPGPGVSIIRNPVKVPLGLFDLPAGYTRHRASKALGLIRQFLDRLGLPPWRQIRLTPMIHGHLGLYLQEYLISICHLYRRYPSICFVDADFFVWDPRFFDALLAGLAPETFASGWLERYDDGASLGANTFYPVGSECFLIQPQRFNGLNWQVETIDPPLQSRLLRKHPQIKFQRAMIDTAYQACWEAQFGGMKIEYAFRGLKTCHIGGFGHANASYIRECLAKQSAEGLATAKFWIQRIRLNERAATALAARYAGGFVSPGLEKIRQRTAVIWQDESICQLADQTPLSEDELLFGQILDGLPAGNC